MTHSATSRRGRTALPARLSALLFTAIVAAPFTVLAQTPLAAQDHAAGQSHEHSHDHGHGHSHGSHDHAHDHGQDDRAAAIARGHFEDAEVQPRPLADWAGEWQSVFPYLEDGTLDPVMAHKAETGDKTEAEYRAYYDKGYRTDTGRIVIEGDRISFTTPTGTVGGRYEPDGFEILTYTAGNRGVRFVFAKVEGDAAAPAFIQFSDHIVAPQKSGHFHLYSGNDRAALLAEMEHWPTYYPAALDGPAIRAEMLAH